MDKLGLGREIERLVMAHDEADGYTCWQPPRSKYTSQDIWGWGDYIAAKSWYPVKVVQVKRYRLAEAETACNAIKAFADAHQCPIAPFIVLWARKRRTELIEFNAWQYTLTGWTFAGQWTAQTP